MPGEHGHEIAHLRPDGRWCTFRPVVVNPIDSLRTITILECVCPLTIRLIERLRPPEERALNADATTTRSEGDG